MTCKHCFPNVSQRPRPNHGYRRAVISPVRITVAIPAPGSRPSEFRRRFVMSIRAAILAASRSNLIDEAVIEECLRAIPRPSSRR